MLKGKFVQGFLWLVGLCTLSSAQSVMLLPGPSGTANTIGVYSASTLTPQTTITNAPAGAFLAIPKPDGTKYYVIANAGSTGITVYDQNFSNGHSISGAISLAPVAAALSPDGRRLVVIAGNMYIYDTGTDQLMNPGGYALTGLLGDVAFSLDSSTAFVLGNNGGTASITAVDLNTGARGNPLQFQTGFASGIALAPNGLLYVGTPGHFYEINPRTLALTPNGDIPTPNIAAGKPVFTPDGKYAIVTNRTSLNGASVALIDLASHTVSGTFANFGVAIDKLIIAGNTRFYAYSSQNNTLYDGTLSGGLNLNPSSLNGILPTNAIGSLVVTPENPARTLITTAVYNGQNNLYRVDLTSNTTTNQQSVANNAGQVLQYVGVNPTSGAAGMLVYNTSQTLAAGGTSLPLVARVVDVNGQGVSGARVDFSTAMAGAVLSPASAFTNSNGYAQTYFTAPGTAGTATVTATSAGAPAMTYQITVTGSSTGGGTGAAAGLSIVSGNGQLIAEQSVSQPLLVVVRDSNGVPVPNTNVTFSITQGGGTLTGLGSQTQVTDANGQAQVIFLATSNSGGQSFQSTTINAASPVGNVNFLITTYLVTLPSGLGATGPVPNLILPLPDNTPPFLRVIRGGVGQIIPGAIQVQLIATSGVQAGQGIPNVGLYVSGGGDPGTAGATCANGAGGVPLTNDQGIATCDLLMGNIISNVPVALNVNLGGAIATPLITIQTTVGPPGKINVLGGNNQSGRAGQTLGQPLRIRVTDTANNPLANVPLTWTVTQGSATLTATNTQTDSAGTGSTTVTLGQTPGTTTITVKAGAAANAPTATFTLTVSVTVGGLVSVSGGGQIAAVGQTFQQPLVIKLTDDKGAALPGFPVTFSVTSGSASLNSTSVTTDSQGLASVTATAGGVAGPVTVTANVGNNVATFNLTVRLPGPPVSVSSFANAASGLAGLTPCGIAIVSAPGLLPGVQGTVDANSLNLGPLPTSLAGADLTVNGFAAPLYWATSSAIAFQTPCEAQPGPATVVMRVNGGSTTVQGVQVLPYQPGIFETVQGGRKFAVLVKEDGSFVTPANPARRGDKLKMYATGLGSVTTQTGTGRAGVGGQTVDAPVTVGVNNGGVRVISSEYLAGEVGLYVITFEVPADTQTGPYQNLALIVAGPDGTSYYGNGSFLPIQ